MHLEVKDSLKWNGVIYSAVERYPIKSGESLYSIML